jgi:hypothetical protein
MLVMMITVVLEAGDSKIIVAPYIYKVFRIDDIEIISGSGIDGAVLKYRFSQDNSELGLNGSS